MIDSLCLLDVFLLSLEQHQVVAIDVVVHHLRLSKTGSSFSTAFRL